jgi:hypothetical protein
MMLYDEYPVSSKTYSKVVRERDNALSREAKLRRKNKKLQSIIADRTKDIQYYEQENKLLREQNKACYVGITEEEIVEVMESCSNAISGCAEYALFSDRYCSVAKAILDKIRGKE